MKAAYTLAIFLTDIQLNVANATIFDGTNKKDELNHYCHDISNETNKPAQCCFSSELALRIHEAARKQLNKTWGSIDSPNCKGFTSEELKSVDFTLVDTNTSDQLK